MPTYTFDDDGGDDDGSRRLGAQNELRPMKHVESANHGLGVASKKSDDGDDDAATSKKGSSSSDDDAGDDAAASQASGNATAAATQATTTVTHVDHLCTCTIDKVRIPLEEGEELSIEYAYHVLDKIKLLNKLYDATGTSAATITDYDDDWPTVYDGKVQLFDGLSQGDTTQLIIWFTKLFAYFPKMGPMTAILGSPADPVFWASHGAWERLWHYARITKMWQNNDNIEETMEQWGRWRPQIKNNPVTTCSWSKQAYSMLPFWNLMDYERSPDIQAHIAGAAKQHKHSYLTNADLNEMFNPQNPSLPFVFDTFSWDHCDQWNGKKGLHGAFDGPVTEATDRELFRMRLRESAWTDLGSLYESGRAAELRSDEEHAQLHEFRSWLYDDESIHDTIDFETGEYR
jgi:hypothetical protein